MGLCGYVLKLNERKIRRRSRNWKKIYIKFELWCHTVLFFTFQIWPTPTQKSLKLKRIKETPISFDTKRRMEKMGRSIYNLLYCEYSHKVTRSFFFVLLMVWQAHFFRLSFSMLKFRMFEILYENKKKIESKAKHLKEKESKYIVWICSWSIETKGRETKMNKTWSKATFFMQ